MADTANDAPEELPIYKRVDKLEEEVEEIKRNILTMLGMIRVFGTHFGTRKVDTKT